MGILENVMTNMSVVHCFSWLHCLAVRMYLVGLQTACVFEFETAQRIFTCQRERQFKGGTQLEWVM